MNIITNMLNDLSLEYTYNGIVHGLGRVSQYLYPKHEFRERCIFVKISSNDEVEIVEIFDNDLMKKRYIHNPTLDDIIECWGPYICKQKL